jgi:hypothetical protein
MCVCVCVCGNKTIRSLYVIISGGFESLVAVWLLKIIHSSVSDDAAAAYTLHCSPRNDVWAYKAGLCYVSCMQFCRQLYIMYKNAKWKKKKRKQENSTK